MFADELSQLPLVNVYPALQDGEVALPVPSPAIVTGLDAWVVHCSAVASVRT